MKSDNFVKLLASDLLRCLKKERGALFALNKKCTGDSDYWIREDYNFICAYLESYTTANLKALSGHFKPKGTIFILLSYNEPFILSIVPIINALIAGNRVILKPSAKAIDFIKTIWQASKIVEKYDLSLQVLSNFKLKDTEKYIKKSQAVYFFGSHGNAKKVAPLCAENFVEFRPEVETADFKVVKYKNKFDVRESANLILGESFTHCGQTCHRIQGAYVHKDNYDDYCRALQENFKKLCNSPEIHKHIDKKFTFNKKRLEDLKAKVLESSPDTIVRSHRAMPLLVIGPNARSSFVTDAYFLPVLWIVKYNSNQDLLNMINSRIYHLGMNINTDDNKFSNMLIESTNFSRYTINKNHARIGISEGWGGSWPSGYSGYKDWIEHFSNPYTIIK